MVSLDPAWLDRMYNNRELVPDHAAYFSRWAQASAAARADEPCTLDVPYGTGPAETLDIFPAARADAPVLVFIHGGYWRSLDKSDHSFVAPAFTRQGACVVVPNYALCPAVTIPQIALQMVQALLWVHAHIARFGGDPSRITVAGHSAGGHLAALLVACQWESLGVARALVRNALSISGLHDLEPIRHTPFLQPSLQLTQADALRASPACMPAPAGVVLNSVAGGDESAEFRRQNVLIRQAWGAQVVPVCETLPGLNHFSVLDALAQDGHRLHQLAQDLLRA
jgi:arylformamidase